MVVGRKASGGNGGVGVTTAAWCAFVWTLLAMVGFAWRAQSLANRARALQAENECIRREFHEMFDISPWGLTSSAALRQFLMLVDVAKPANRTTTDMLTELLIEAQRRERDNEEVGR